MRIIELKIKGMTCDNCATSIEKQFKNKAGIVEKEVSYQKGSGRFTFDEKKISKEEIIKTINDTVHYRVVNEIISSTAEKIERVCKEDEKPSFWQPKIFLEIVTVFAILMMAFPYYGFAFYPNNKKKEVAIVHQNDIQILQLNVQGMTCSVCNSNVENAAYQVGGVIEAKADYRTGKAVVKFDKSKTSAAKIIKSIDATRRYKVVGNTLEHYNKKKATITQQNDIQTLQLNVQGMTCSVCNSNVENAAYEVGGVIEAKADYRTGKAVVKFDKSKTSAAKIIKSIDATRYKVVGDTLEH